VDNVDSVVPRPDHLGFLDYGVNFRQAGLHASYYGKLQPCASAPLAKRRASFGGPRIQARDRCEPKASDRRNEGGCSQFAPHVNA
jgi:hypothetical protein